MRATLSGILKSLTACLQQDSEHSFYLSDLKKILMERRGRIGQKIAGSARQIFLSIRTTLLILMNADEAVQRIGGDKIAVAM